MGIFTHVNGWCGAAWYPPRGYNPTPPDSKPGKQENRPRIRDGTKAATTDNHLILPILYSSGKQDKIKSRDYFPADIYLQFSILALILHQSPTKGDRKYQNTYYYKYDKLDIVFSLLFRCHLLHPLNRHPILNNYLCFVLLEGFRVVLLEFSFVEAVKLHMINFEG